MRFFSFKAKDKDKEKEKEKKAALEKKTGTPETKLNVSHGRTFSYNSGSRSGTQQMPVPTGPVANLSINELNDFYENFSAVLSCCPNPKAKLAGVKRLRALCPQLMASTPHILKSDVAFGDDFPVMQLLGQLLAESVPVRLRQVMALHSFCCVIEHELEEDSMIMNSGSGFLAALRREAGLPEDVAAAKVEAPCPFASLSHEVDLAKVYRRLLKGDAYLPKAEEMHEIITQFIAMMSSTPNVVAVPLPAVVVGDIHGQMRDLLQEIIPAGGPLVPPCRVASVAAPKKTASTKSSHSVGGKPSSPQPQPGTIRRTASYRSVGAASKTTDSKTVPNSPAQSSSGDFGDASAPTYLFLGDYVDRGTNSLGCMCLLFVAKLLSPDTVFLLRGNHECTLTNKHYGFLEECHRMYPIIDGVVTTHRHEKVDGAQADANPTPVDLMDWDMPDHPIWVAANEAFKLLPLCGALYEKVPVKVTAPHITATTPNTPSPQPSPKPSPLPAFSATECGGTPLPRKTATFPTKASSDCGAVKESERASTARSHTAHSEDNNSAPLPVTPCTSSWMTSAGESYEEQVRVVAVHGGLSPYIDGRIDGIMAITRRRNIDLGAMADLTWSDPTTSNALTRPLSSANIAGTKDLSSKEEEVDTGMPADDFSHAPNYTGSVVGYSFSPRGTGHSFGEDVTVSFVKTNNLYFVVRAHQCVMGGFQWSHQGRLLTVFSASNYCGLGNKGSVLLLDAKAQPRLVQYASKENSKLLEHLGNPHLAPIPPKGFA